MNLEKVRAALSRAKAAIAEVEGELTGGQASGSGIKPATFQKEEPGLRRFENDRGWACVEVLDKDLLLEMVMVLKRSLANEPEDLQKILSYAEDHAKYGSTTEGKYKMFGAVYKKSTGSWPVFVRQKAAPRTPPPMFNDQEPEIPF